MFVSNQVGLCISGGGLSAACAVAGVGLGTVGSFEFRQLSELPSIAGTLRALEHLNLAKEFTQLSVVGGSAWATAAYVSLGWPVTETVQKVEISEEMEIHGKFMEDISERFSAASAVHLLGAPTTPETLTLEADRELVEVPHVDVTSVTSVTSRSWTPFQCPCCAASSPPSPQRPKRRKTDRDAMKSDLPQAGNLTPQKKQELCISLDFCRNLYCLLLIRRIVVHFQISQLVYGFFRNLCELRWKIRFTQWIHVPLRRPRQRRQDLFRWRSNLTVPHMPLWLAKEPW